jgi:Cytotoxic
VTDYVLPPKGGLPGFPEAKRARPKTAFSGGMRHRWKDGKYIYEWDYRHGHVEKYDRRGKHLGAFNPRTGEQLKGPDASKKVEP